jgi:predicted chitinase
MTANKIIKTAITTAKTFYQIFLLIVRIIALALILLLTIMGAINQVVNALADFFAGERYKVENWQNTAEFSTTKQRVEVTLLSKVITLAFVIFISLFCFFSYYDTTPSLEANLPAKAEVTNVTTEAKKTKEVYKNQTDFTKEFIDKYNNKKIDFDKALGHQCMDLVNQFRFELTGFNPDSRINLTEAHQIFKQPDGFFNSMTFYTKTEYKTGIIPKTGDIVVWNKNNNLKYGHTAIITRANETAFEVMEQNTGNGDGNGDDDRTKLNIYLNYENILGFLTINYGDKDKIKTIDLPTKEVDEIKEQLKKKQNKRYERANVSKLNGVAQKVVNECNAQNYKDNAQLAYILATAEHETGNWIFYEEINGRQQARRLNYSGGENYYGRGLIHITHDYNYKKYGDIFNIDLLNNPDLAKDEAIASKIICRWFIEKKIDHYINEKHILYEASRALVNGDTSFYSHKYKMTIGAKLSERAMFYYNILTLSEG